MEQLTPDAFGRPKIMLATAGSVELHSTLCWLRSTGLPSLSVTRYGSFTDCARLMASESLSNVTSRTLGRTVTVVASL